MFCDFVSGRVVIDDHASRTLSLLPPTIVSYSRPPVTDATTGTISFTSSAELAAHHAVPVD